MKYQRIQGIRRGSLLIPTALLLISVVTARAADLFESGAKPRLLLESGAGEGPAWHPELGLFFSGPEGITRLTQQDTSELFLSKAGSNGLLFDHRGMLLICQPANRHVSRMNVKSKELEVLARDYRGRKFNTPNDITVDSRGRIYFSDPRYGDREGMELVDVDGREIEGVYRIDEDGSISRIITHEVERPNGVLVSADDRYLFVADNNNNSVGGARKLWRFELATNGNVRLETQKLLFDWGTGRGPDGMVMDVEGRLYVAGGRNTAVPPYETVGSFPGGVYVLSAEGDRLGFVAIPRDEVTNCTFGGSDLKTLFITAGGTLWSIRTTTPGRLPWPSP